ncbi:hypothetical protein, partial [Brevundimonas sp.]|uniref:hypothetical protein n=1 Tax=Brevundimonas sp. TaxID=1871086 RepID=UPI00289AA26D
LDPHLRPSNCRSIRSSDARIASPCASSRASRSATSACSATFSSSAEIRAAAPPAQTNPPIVCTTNATTSATGICRNPIKSLHTPKPFSHWEKVARRAG